VVRLLHKAELLNGEIFYTLREAQILIERWRKHYNAVRPHSSLGYRTPAPETILPPASILAYAPLQPVQKTTLTLALWAVEGEKSDGAVDIDGMSVVGTI